MTFFQFFLKVLLGGTCLCPFFQVFLFGVCAFFVFVGDSLFFSPAGFVVCIFLVRL